MQRSQVFFIGHQDAIQQGFRVTLQYGQGCTQLMGYISHHVLTQFPVMAQGGCQEVERLTQLRWLSGAVYIYSLPQVALCHTPHRSCNFTQRRYDLPGKQVAKEYGKCRPGEPGNPQGSSQVVEKIPFSLGKVLTAHHTAAHHALHGFHVTEEGAKIAGGGTIGQYRHQGNPQNGGQQEGSGESYG